jgi:hypothetical protein
MIESFYGVAWHKPQGGRAYYIVKASSAFEAKSLVDEFLNKPYQDYSPQKRSFSCEKLPFVNGVCPLILNNCEK